jgi:hypothetical protein
MIDPPNDLKRPRGSPHRFQHIDEIRINVHASTLPLLVDALTMSSAPLTQTPQGDKFHERTKGFINVPLEEEDCEDWEGED